MKSSNVLSYYIKKSRIARRCFLVFFFLKAGLFSQICVFRIAHFLFFLLLHDLDRLTKILARGSILQTISFERLKILCQHSGKMRPKTVFIISDRMKSKIARSSYRIIVKTSSQTTAKLSNQIIVRIKRIQIIHRLRKIRIDWFCRCQASEIRRRVKKDFVVRFSTSIIEDLKKHV